MVDLRPPYVLEVQDDARANEALEALDSAGGRVRHRYGRVLLVDLPEPAETPLRRRLPNGVRLLSPREIQARPSPTGESLEALGLAAARLRTTPGFRRAHDRRRNEGKEWGEGGQPAPCMEEDEGGADAPRRVPPPSREEP